ncbi:Phoxous domain [Trinorchestia longiramus]|nr:Phoxous domain [Trinorchestia longiramus]
MADTTRDPPPLFDDEPTTKEEDGDDLFSSAVQSPVNGQETPDMTKTAAAEVNLESSSVGDASSDVIVPQLASSDPLQSGSKEADQGRNVQSPAPNSSSSELQPNQGYQPASLSVIDDDSFEGPSSLSSIGVTGISNLQPVPRNMYNISSMGDVEDVTNSMDLFESCVEDAVVRPFAAASITGPQQGVEGFEEPYADGAFFGIIGAVGQPETLDSVADVDASSVLREKTTFFVELPPLPGTSFEDPPVPDSMDTSIVPVDTPATALVDTPATAPVDTPATALVDTPAIALVDTPATALVATPATALVDTPATALVDTPATALVDTPATALVDTPATALVDTPATALVDTHAAAPVDSASTGTAKILDAGVHVPSTVETSITHFGQTNHKVSENNLVQKSFPNVSCNEKVLDTVLNALSIVTQEMPFEQPGKGNNEEPLISGSCVPYDLASSQAATTHLSEISDPLLRQGIVNENLNFGQVSDKNTATENFDHPLFTKVKLPQKKAMESTSSSVKAAVSPHFISEEETSDIPLEVSLDDDDDGLFSGGAFDKSQLKTSAPVAPTAAAAAVLPPMGVPLTPPAATAASSAAAPVTPAASATPESATIASTTSNITTPPLPTAAVGLPATGFYSPAQPASFSAPHNMVPTGAASSNEFIEIMISEPQKVGDGMNSYMAYKMTINTNIPFFKKKSWMVTRRFSDYLGLHSKLVEKHLHAGRIIPPAPEKDALNATKLRLSSSSDGVEGAAEFLERRRAALQRYMQRTAALSHLRSDPDFREFIELEAELPRATQTSAMSGAGVMRLFNRVGETVNKMTFKMEESDSERAFWPILGSVPKSHAVILVADGHTQTDHGGSRPRTRVFSYRKRVRSPVDQAGGHQSTKLVVTSQPSWWSPVNHAGGHQSAKLVVTNQPSWWSPISQAGGHQSTKLGVVTPTQTPAHLSVVDRVCSVGGLRELMESPVEGAMFLHTAQHSRCFAQVDAAHG